MVISGIKRFLREADLLLLATCVVTTVFGIVLISSASLSLPDGPSRYVTIQIIAAVIGIFAFVFMSMIDIEYISALWKYILAFNIVMMLMLIPFGQPASGIQGDTNLSWIRFEPFLPMGIQPAEIVKITFILLLAMQMFYLRDKLSSILSMAQITGHFIFMAALIYLISKDDGMVLMYALIFLTMLVAAGVKPRWFVLASAALAAAIPLVWYNLKPYQRLRIEVVFDPNLDLEGVGWQGMISKMALGGGQLFGQGLYQGTQTQYGRLPARQTDFIFAVCGEELGFLGCLVIIILLTTIICRCLYVASKAKTAMSMLVCVGIAGMLISQVIVNIGMCVGILPIVGVTLPFLSYGGTSIITMYMAMGIVSGVRRRPMPHWLKDRANRDIS